MQARLSPCGSNTFSMAYGCPMSDLAQDRWYRFSYKTLDGEFEGRYLGLLQVWPVPDDGGFDPGGALRFHWFFVPELEGLLKIDPDYLEDFEEISEPTRA
jgi:hypothetical protein